MPIGQKILLWGAASQGRLALNLLKQCELGEVAAIFDPTAGNRVSESLRCDSLFTSDIGDLISRWPSFTSFVSCIGSEHGFARARTSDTLERLGLQPLGLMHPTSWIDRSAVIGKGCMFMAGAKVQAFVEIGGHSIVNTGALIDHECLVGRGVHIMGGAVLTGRVRVGDYATIGANATVLPDIDIGESAIIGAGAVVTKSVPRAGVVVGVPGRVVRQRGEPAWDREVLDRLESGLCGIAGGGILPGTRKL